MSCVDESSNETNNCHGGTVLEGNNQQQAPIPCCDNDTLQNSGLVISSSISHSITTPVTCNAKEESTNNGGTNSEMVKTDQNIPLTVHLLQHSELIVATPSVQLTEMLVTPSQSRSYVTTKTGYSVKISGDTTNLVCIK